MADSVSSDDSKTFVDLATFSSDEFVTAVTAAENQDVEKVRYLLAVSTDEFITATPNDFKDGDETLKDIQSLSDSYENSDEQWQEFESENEENKHSDEDKINVIITELKLGNIQTVKYLGRERGGFICDSVRRLVWPKLTKTDIVQSSPRPSTAEMENHMCYEQVILDVNRSIKRFPPSIHEEQRLSLQTQLVNLIMRVLIKNPGLHYYQGYHDICITFLLIVGEENAFHIVNSISKTHLRTFMEKTMESTADLLELIPLLVSEEDPELANFLLESEVGIIFSLSWVITWFSHVLTNYQSVGRLFDLFIVSSRYFPIYLSTSIVIHKRKEILDLNCDLASVHQYLCKIPEHAEKLDFEHLINETDRLITNYPPKTMLEIGMEKKTENQKKGRKDSVFINFISRFKDIFNLSSKIGFFSITAALVFSAMFIQYYRTI